MCDGHQPGSYGFANDRNIMWLLQTKEMFSVVLTEYICTVDTSCLCWWDYRSYHALVFQLQSVSIIVVKTTPWQQLDFSIKPAHSIKLTQSCLDCFVVSVNLSFLSSLCCTTAPRETNCYTKSLWLLYYIGLLYIVVSQMVCFLEMHYICIANDGLQTKIILLSFANTAPGSAQLKFTCLLLLYIIASSLPRKMLLFMPHLF